MLPTPSGYSQMSPTTATNMYQQHPYYSQDITLPPQQHGIIPQLDRQLVFGAYAGMDPNSLSTHTMLDGANSWDIQMGGMQDFQWQIPFNMEPPDIHEADFFNTMGGAYAIGGMPGNAGAHGN